MIHFEFRKPTANKKKIGTLSRCTSKRCKQDVKGEYPCSEQYILVGSLSTLKYRVETKWLQWDSTNNYAVRKRTLNHLVKFEKWLSCVVATCLFGVFDYMFLSCHVRVLEWIHILQLLECQGTPFLEQARHLKYKWELSSCGFDLSCCGFESRCSHLTLRYRTCFEQGVPWH